MPLPPGSAPAPHGAPQPGGVWETWSTWRLLLWTALLMSGDFLLQAACFGLTDRLFASVAAGSLLAVVLPCHLLARSRGGSLASEFHLGRVPGPLLFWAALAAVGSLLPTSLLAEASLRIHPVPENWLSFYTDHLPRGDLDVALAAVAVVALGPVAEELIFRGLLYRLARRAWGASPAAVVSALAFGLLHGEPWYLFGLVGLGLLLAFVYEMTGSLTPGIVLHGVYNGASFFLLLQDADLAAGASGGGGWDVLLLAGSLGVLTYACLRLARER